MLLLHIMIYLWYTSAALTWSLGFQPKSPTAIWSSPQIFDNYLVFSNSKTYSLSFSKYSSHLRWLSFYQRHNNSPKVLAWNLGVMPDFILNHCLYRHFKSSCPFSIDFNAFLSHLTYLDPEPITAAENILGNAHWPSWKLMKTSFLKDLQGIWPIKWYPFSVCLFAV